VYTTAASPEPTVQVAAGGLPVVMQILVIPAAKSFVLEAEQQVNAPSHVLDDEQSSPKTESVGGGTG